MSSEQSGQGNASDGIRGKIMPVLRNEGLGSLMRKGGGHIQRTYIDKLVRRCAEMSIPKAVRAISRLGAMSPEEAFAFADGWFAGLFRPQQQTDEFLRLLHMVQERCPRRYVEIGTAQGGMLFCCSRVVADDAVLISLDLPGGYAQRRLPLYRSFARDKQTVHLVQADSHDPATADQVRGLLAGESVDFLFIDGDHTYDGARRDYELYSPLVGAGGMIGFHDINLGNQSFGGGSRILWQELRGQMRSMELIGSPDTPYWGIGLLFPE